MLRMHIFSNALIFLLYIQLIFYALFIQISDREIEYIKSLNKRLDASNTILLVQKLKKNVKCQSYFKSTKIDAFEHNKK